MKRPPCLFAIAAVAACLSCLSAAAQTLYVATMRGQAASTADPSRAPLVSGLYTVNLGTGTANFAAPLRVNGLRNRPRAASWWAVAPWVLPVMKMEWIENRHRR